MTNNELLQWLSRRLDRKPHRLLTVIHTWLSVNENRGKHRQLDVEVKTAIFLRWHKYSILSVDSRNGRDIMCIKEEACNSEFSGISLPPDAAIETFTLKTNIPMLKAPKHIATKTIRCPGHSQGKVWV